jgi:hypothetical protein
MEAESAGCAGRSRESSAVFRQKLGSKGRSNHRPKLDILVRPDTMVVVPSPKRLCNALVPRPCNALYRRIFFPYGVAGWILHGP